MKPISLIVVAAIVGLSLLAGCAPWHVYSQKVGSADLSRLKSFYVIHNKDDTGGLGDVIQSAFDELGFDATVGQAEEVPNHVDAIVTYEFHWFWDIATYLLMLKILMRSPDTEFPLAMGESVRTSLARKSPKDMALEILTPLLNPMAKPGLQADY